MILNRSEVDFNFVVFDGYFNSPHNEICDSLPRLPPEEAQKYANSTGLKLIDVLPTFQWFLADRLRLRSLIVPPDPPDRVEVIMQFAEKRLVLDIPPSVKESAHFYFFGLGGRHVGLPNDAFGRIWYPFRPIVVAFRIILTWVFHGSPGLAQGGPLSVWT